MSANPVHSLPANSSDLSTTSGSPTLSTHLGELARMADGAYDKEVPVRSAFHENDHRSVDRVISLVQKDAAQPQPGLARRVAKFFHRVARRARRREPARERLKITRAAFEP